MIAYVRKNLLNNNNYCSFSWQTCDVRETAHLSEADSRGLPASHAGCSLSDTDRVQWNTETLGKIASLLANLPHFQVLASGHDWLRNCTFSIQ